MSVQKVRPVDTEHSVHEPEGLGSGSFLFRLEVLTGPEEPEEGDDDEVDGSPIGLAVDLVLGVEDIVEGLDDGDVHRVGPSCWVVFVSHGFEKSSE